MNQAQRVLHILEKLRENSYEPICTVALAEEYFVYKYSSTKESALRIAQNDMKLIKQFLGENLITISKGCYNLINENFVNAVFPTLNSGKNYKKFFEFLVLFDNKILKDISSQSQNNYINKLQKNMNKIYSIHATPIEDLQNTNIMDKMKHAVKYRRYINLSIYDDDDLLTSNNDNLEKFENIQPHRIVFAQGNWYLAIYDQNQVVNNGFRFLRAGKITELEITSNTFQKNTDIEHYIENFQSLFTYFNKEYFRVVLKISPRVSKYFMHKKYLSSQSVVDPAFDDGSLRIHYDINNEMEILPLVKKWLPDVEIISPQWLRDKYYEDLSLMLQKR